MMDSAKLRQYRENNQIEAKRALGGLPLSIWETYSSFANTVGGVILLGVDEYRDKSLHAVDLPHPELLVQEFWEIINDPERTSVNILTERNVRIDVVNGCHIIVITVPGAQWFDKPVYLDGDPSNAYYRNGDGDYRYSAEELRAIFRSASVVSEDQQILENSPAEAFDMESVHRYRWEVQSCRPGHRWKTLDDLGFLCQVGAVGTGRDGKPHPTVGGLLMFGQKSAILREFPGYFLEYREQLGKNGGTPFRILSEDEGSTNLYDFYTRIVSRLQGSVRAAESAASCLVCADYEAKGGLMVEYSGQNGFSVEMEKVRTVPGNAVLMRLFYLLNAGE